MNYIDYIIIIILIIAAIRGGYKGLIVEVASLLALILGIWGAIRFSGATETYIVNRLGWENPHIDIVAFAITLIIIVVLVHLIAKAIEKMVEAMALSPINRILGVVVAVAKAVFFLSVLLIMIDRVDEYIPALPEEDIQESRLYEPMHNIAISTFPFLQGVYDEWKGKRNNATDEDKDIDANQPQV